MVEAFLWGLAAASTLLLGALLTEVRVPAKRTLEISTAANMDRLTLPVCRSVSPNVPEGIAATAGLRAGGWTLASVVSLWSGIALASALAAGLGYAALDGASADVLAFILAFAGGAVLTMLATSMMPEADEHAGRSVGVLTVLGFTLAFVIAWLEG